MSRHGSRVQVQRRTATKSEPQISDNPITIGLDRAIGVDLSKLKAPVNVYDADVSWLVHKPGRVSVFFGKQVINDPMDEHGDKLRTRLELRYPPEAFVAHFWKNSRDFAGRVRNYVESWRAKVVEDESAAARTWRATRDHSDWVNFEAMAHAGSEATIDFYQLPPTGIARFYRGQGSSGLTAQPIVRVQLTVFELMRLFDEAAGIVQEVERYLPLAEREGEIVQEGSERQS